MTRGPKPARPLVLRASSLTSALGPGLAPHRRALRADRSGLERCTFEDTTLETRIGRVAGLEDQPLEGPLAPYDCRNNRLAWRGLLQDGFASAVAAARDRLGPERIGVFIGSSTSGVDRTEHAYQARDPASGALPAWFDYRHTHDAFATADFVARVLGLEGVTVVVATACSSSAKALVSAGRHLAAGLCEAAVVGGVDCLGLTTLYGFNALELLAREPCRPWDPGRVGISLGEAAAFALVEPAGPADRGDIGVLGFGESSDAYHMSHPRPDGAAAAEAMREALARAGLPPDAIDYVNLHGTGTPSNDLAEDRAVVSVFGTEVPCSSTKPMTGHTLGAAGLVEALLTGLAIEEGWVPGMPTTRSVDPELQAAVRLRGEARTLIHALSNSFGFGGSNCSLILGRINAP